jgi:hypothetical protein
MTTPWIQPDAIDVGSAWASMSWTGWPPYKSPDFMAWLANQRSTLGDFMQTDRYRAAVNCGLIEGDEWTGREFPIGRPGWIDGEPLPRQLRLRADSLFHELRDQLAGAQTEAGRVLYARETAAILVGAADSWTLRDGIGGDLTITDAPPPPAGRRVPDQVAAWDRALPNASGPLAGALASVPAPPICLGPVARAVYEPNPGRIVVATMTDDVGLRRAAAHWLGGLGWNGHAALSIRAAHVADGPLVPLGAGAAALPGTWVDPDDARLVGADPKAVERAILEGRRFTAAELVARWGVPAEDEPAPPQHVLAGAAGRFAPGRDLDLSLTWELWPEQVLVWLLVMRGAFVRVPEV